jgi:alginate O-acetyltransferase complex protein AlgI
MVFTTHFFIFYFLPATLLIYYLLPKGGQNGMMWKNLFLTIISYVFYGWFKPWYVSLMLISSVIDYTAGWGISTSGNNRKRKIAFLTMSMVSNLSLLGFFKYYMFTAANMNYLLQLFGQPGFEIMRVILPIGISFYTFQTMSYTIDVYRGDAPMLKNFFDFSCFVALFPQLIAGPIVRYNTIAEQLIYREHKLEPIARGISLFMIGFAKKILLANPCAIVADTCFGAQSLTAFDAWYGVMAYSFQIYFDFCAYSDMAVGLGRMFGFEFLKNFNSPYISKSITEVWRRWHISLSTWLRDYLYISLGGNRKGEKRTYINLAMVMVLGGLWHGANWQFIVWGAFHGSLLAFERWRGKESVYSRLPGPVQMAITYVLMLISWVLFRAENLGLAMKYLGNMFGLREVSATAALVGPKIYTPYLVFFMVLCAFLSFRKLEAMDWIDSGLNWKKVTVSAVLFGLALMGMVSQAFNPFIYFQF